MNQDIDQSMSEVMLDVAAMMDVIVADPALTSLIGEAQQAGLASCFGLGI